MLHLAVLFLLLLLSDVGSASVLSEQRATGTSPQIKLPPRKKDFDHEPINVLISHTFIGSHLRNTKEIIEWLR